MKLASIITATTLALALVVPTPKAQLVSLQYKVQPLT